MAILVQALVAEVRDVLRYDDPAAVIADETLIDLVCDMRKHQYFRSEDAVEAVEFLFGFSC